MTLVAGCFFVLASQVESCFRMDKFTSVSEICCIMTSGAGLITELRMKLCSVNIFVAARTKLCFNARKNKLRFKVPEFLIFARYESIGRGFMAFFAVGGFVLAGQFKASFSVVKLEAFGEVSGAVAFIAGFVCKCFTHLS